LPVKKGGWNLTPYILMMALSIHSCFEGLACGLSMNLGAVLNIVLAIGIHKSAASTSLGIALVKTFPNDIKVVRWCILIFSVATPIGILLGMLLSIEGEIYTICFNSLAAGTFLYIACNEMIVGEFSLPGNRWLKLFIFLMGASLILGLWFIPGA
jgi:zinc transporter 1/2/3